MYNRAIDCLIERIDDARSLWLTEYGSQRLFMKPKTYIIVKIVIKLFNMSEYILFTFSDNRSAFAYDAKKHAVSSKKCAIVLKILLYSTKKCILLSSLNKSDNCEIQIYNCAKSFVRRMRNYQDE